MQRNLEKCITNFICDKTDCVAFHIYGTARIRLVTDPKIVLHQLAGDLSTPILDLEEFNAICCVRLRAQFT